MEFFFEQNAEVPEADFETKVPAEFKPFYVKDQAGVYKVGEQFAAAATTHDGLRKNFTTTRANLTAVNGESAQRRVQLEAWAAVGGVATPDELKTKIDKMMSDLTEGKKINPDTIRAELQQGFQTQVDAAKAETTAMEGSLKEYILDNAAMQAINEQKGNSTLLLPHVQRMATVMKDPATGKYRAVAVNAAGEPLPDTDGGWLSIGKLVERMKANKDFAACFTVQTPSGGGLPPNNGRTQVPPNNGQRQNGTGDGERSPMDKISAGLAKRRLPVERAGA
jgi:hypothetical protein